MNENNFLHSDIKEIAQRISHLTACFEGKRILMTGGNGFLGRYFRAVFHYLNNEVFTEKCQLTLLDNFTTSKQETFESTDGNIRCIQHNVIEPFAYEGELDYIIHAAGIASPYYYRAEPLMTLEVASIGSKHMLDLAKKTGARYTFFSSSEIYGDPDPKHVPIPESYRGNVNPIG
ncbi:MAG: nucleoside-diphosphate sugar epimerase, partial [Coxiella sp. (in: Bacteria)]